MYQSIYYRLAHGRGEKINCLHQRQTTCFHTCHPTTIDKNHVPTPVTPLQDKTMFPHLSLLYKIKPCFYILLSSTRQNHVSTHVPTSLPHNKIKPCALPREGTPILGHGRRFCSDDVCFENFNPIGSLFYASSQSEWPPISAEKLVYLHHI